MKPIDIEELRRMVPVAGMLRAPDASPEKPSPVLDAAEVRAMLLAHIDGLPTGRVAEVVALLIDLRTSRFAKTVDGAAFDDHEIAQVENLIEMLRKRGEAP